MGRTAAGDAGEVGDADAFARVGVDHAVGVDAADGAVLPRAAAVGGVDGSPGGSALGLEAAGMVRAVFVFFVDVGDDGRGCWGFVVVVGGEGKACLEGKAGGGADDAGAGGEVGCGEIEGFDFGGLVGLGRGNAGGIVVGLAV